jgi:hypothetical protein
VGDVLEHVHAGDAVGLQEGDGLAVGLGEERGEHVPGVHLLLVRGLGLERGALDDTLEAQGLLGHEVVVAVERLKLLVEPGVYGGAKAGQVAAAGLQDLFSARIVQQREEQVLEGEELVATALGLTHGEVQRDL